MTHPAIRWLCLLVTLGTLHAQNESVRLTPELLRTEQQAHNELLSRLLETNMSIRLDTPPTCSHLVNYSASPIDEASLDGNWEIFRSKLIVIIEVVFEQIMDVDERLKRITCRLVITMHWRDCRFIWEPEEWAGITEVHVTDLKGSNIFLPTIILRETLESAVEWRIGRTLHVWHSGLLSLPVRTDLISSCLIDTYLYPFDVHDCKLTFEATEDAVHKLALTSLLDPERHEKQFLEKFGGPHLDKYYVKSDHWQFIWHEHSLQNCTDPDLNETFSHVVHRFRIRRHPGYHLVNVVFPCVITMLISSFVFMIPPGSGDKMSLCVSIMLSLIVFTQLMFDRMPETGSTLPIISQYFLFCNGMVAISCIVSVTGMVLVKKGETEDKSSLPRALKVVFLDLLGCMVLRNEMEKAARDKALPSSSSCYENVVITVDANAQEVHKEPKSPNSNEWFLFALVIDRVFFLLHISTTVVLLLVYLIGAYGAWVRSIHRND